MSQSLSKIYLHLIFSTKNRERNILPQYEEELFKYIAGALGGQDCPPILVGGDIDHIHALFCLSRNKAVSDVVRDVKSQSTKWFKKRFKCNFKWQAGYAIFSVSHSVKDKVNDYIKNQKAHHHAGQDFQTEYLAFLDAHEIEYDLEYVFE